MTFSKLYIPESQKQRLMWSSNSGKTKPKNYGTGSSNLASSTSRDIERPMPSIGDPAVGSKQRRKLALSSAHVRDEAQLASRGKRKMEALRILAADALWKMETREEGKSAGSIQMDARPRKKRHDGERTAQMVREGVIAELFHRRSGRFAVSLKRLSDKLPCLSVLFYGDRRRGKQKRG
jgi:hypothetical protein